MTGSTRLKCVLIFIFIADLSGMPKKTPYEFIYNVDDSLSGNDFGHWESSDGQVVHGQYHVLLPDGQRQTVEYTADAVNGYQAKTVTYTADVVNAYQAKVAVNTSTFQVADSIQQGVNQGKESNFVQALTYDQDTKTPPKYLVCPYAMRIRYDECKANCKKLSCWWEEKRNFLYACLSGIIQNCTGSPTTSKPKLVCDVSEGYFKVDGETKCFKTFRDRYYTWSKANLKCKTHGLQLAKPNDAIAVRKYIVENYGNGYTWVGAKGNGVNLQWILSQGVVSNFSPLWYPSCPGNDVTTQWCLRLLTWDDIMGNLPTQPYASWKCSAQHYALCEL